MLRCGFGVGGGGVGEPPKHLSAYFVTHHQTTSIQNSFSDTKTEYKTASPNKSLTAILQSFDMVHKEPMPHIDHNADKTAQNATKICRHQRSTHFNSIRNLIEFSIQHNILILLFLVQYNRLEIHHNL
jgi:hypothetical protein